MLERRLRCNLSVEGEAVIMRVRDVVITLVEVSQLNALRYAICGHW